MATLAVVATPGAARAQDSGPLALLLPVSARPAALGNAWVAGRDEYAVFSNPAQVTATTGFGLTVGAYGADTRTVATAAGVTVGPYTIGWGVHFVNFSAPRSWTGYPLTPALLTRSGDADQFSMLALVATQRTVKNFRIGLAAKYAQDIVPREVSTTSLLVVPTRGSAWLADVGTSHALWTGTAGLAVQNIGQPYLLRGRRVSVPAQVALGWTALRQWGPFDYGFATQVIARRQGWIGVGGGVEMGWSWIEGYSVTGRVGARRTESPGPPLLTGMPSPAVPKEAPVSVGASFNADRLNVEYAGGFFSNSTFSHRLTLRWR